MMRRWIAAGAVTLALGCSDDAHQTPRPNDDGGATGDMHGRDDGGGTSPGKLDAGDAAAALDAQIGLDASTPATTDGAVRAKLLFTPCDDTFQCATLSVPLDYGHPDGDSIQLAIKMLPASGARRIGSLLINPGGPGSSAIDFLTGWVGSDVPPGDKLLQNFDLVAVDPRGVGQSTPLTCHSTVQALFATDPTPNDEAAWQALIAAEQTFADECTQLHAKLLPHLSTLDNARDLDRVREALGEDKLSYLGFSYGTELGAYYANLFPDHVRVLALDGAVDPEVGPIDQSIQQGASFDLALGHYFDWCRANPKRCKWTDGQDPKAAFDALQAEIEATPIPSSYPGRPAGPGEFLTGVSDLTYYGEDGWDPLSSILSDAVDGDGTGLVDATDDYLERNEDGSYPNSIEMYFATTCLDQTAPSVAQIRAAVPRANQTAPYFGETMLTEEMICGLWGAQGETLPKLSGAGAPPILVVGSTGDPATPYGWAQALSKELASGVLLTRDGEGHTAYQMGGRCIDDAIEAYLVDTTVPSAPCPKVSARVFGDLTEKSVRKLRRR